ncbi:uncharacterized protein V6R79_014918 [Siganus canaliculatus]
MSTARLVPLTGKKENSAACVCGSVKSKSSSGRHTVTSVGRTDDRAEVLTDASTIEQIDVLQSGPFFGRHPDDSFHKRIPKVKCQKCHQITELFFPLCGPCSYTGPLQSLLWPHAWAHERINSAEESRILKTLLLLH